MIRLLFLCALLLLPSLPVMAQDTDQPTGTIGIEDSAERDAAIAQRIREILQELEGYEDVTVTVSSGIATLKGTTLDGETADRLTSLVGRVEGIVAIENEVTETTDVAQRLNPAIDRFVDRLDQFVAFLPLLAVAFLAFAIVFGIGLLVARMQSPWNRIAPNAFIADILRVIVRLAFLIAGIVVALDILGATALLSTILGAAGIIGLAIGFAVKDTVENFIASVMLSIRQPFRPNDTIEIDGDIGNVIRLTSRATILLSFDGNHIRIPNATVFKSRIVNYTRNDERRFLFDFGVAADADLGRARDIAQAELEKLPFVLKEPAVSVWIEDLGDSSVTLRMTAWISQRQTSFASARGEAIRIVKHALETSGIALPEPTYRLITQSGESSAGQMTPPAPAPEVQDVGAKAEEALERIVEDERQETRREDLLKSDAPEE